MKASCTNPKWNPDWWYEENSPQGRTSAKEYARRTENSLTAMRICSTCPLFNMKECIAVGFESIHTLDYGIFSGMLPFERRGILNFAVSGPKYDFQRKLRNMAILEGLPTPRVSLSEAKKWSKNLGATSVYFSIAR